jgi:hypothetical protein
VKTFEGAVEVIALPIFLHEVALDIVDNVPIVPSFGVTSILELEQILIPGTDLCESWGPVHYGSPSSRCVIFVVSLNSEIPVYKAHHPVEGIYAIILFIYSVVPKAVLSTDFSTMIILVAFEGIQFSVYY